MYECGILAIWTGARYARRSIKDRQHPERRVWTRRPSGDVIGRTGNGRKNNGPKGKVAEALMASECLVVLWPPPHRLLPALHPSLSLILCNH
jgi:hypothetical protein